MRVDIGVIALLPAYRKIDRGVCSFQLRRSEVVFWIDEWSIEFGYHWLMLLMFLTAHLFQFRFVDSEQYCNMALRLRCRRHKFLVVRH